MRNDLTDITIVVDRSGSMRLMQADAEGGINEFIRSQKTQPGQANLTLVEFDTTIDFVYRGIPLAEAKDYKLVPRGSTALLDAVGQSINATGERLAKMAEADRPGIVIMVVVTDGGENASKEFKRDQIRSMVEHQTNTYRWKFVYLGANQDAFAESGNMGFSQQFTSGYTNNNVQAAYANVSSKLSSIRGMSIVGESEATMDCAMTFTDEDRKDLTK